jgi:hypothetical protein
MPLRERNSFALRQLLQPGCVKSMNFSATVFMYGISARVGMQGYSAAASNVKTITKRSHMKGIEMHGAIIAHRFLYFF